ncbi:MAG: ABC transporter ATP-binding protein [Nitrososphaerota archaeon]|nr:ABC transporter ATP-binding protein [Candidatus Bathyarchaeota archaeon]MDW8023963.1 ABC transporter ATP-binding protein [Nitrososphaerota archaeon]
MAVLSVNNLKLYYGTLRGSVKAVDDVAFDLEGGEALGLVGESGCGKSSTAIALIRLLPSNVVKFEGEILFKGKNLMNLNEGEIRSQIRWKKISMVFQGAMNSLNPVLKAGFQVAEPLIVHKNVDKKEALEKAKELFKLVGLPPEFTERYPHELSGGMRQRVVIATALALNPEIVILDEPTSALDVSVQAQIMNLLKRLKKQLHLSMIYITHDIALASDLCDKIGVMYVGEIVELGPIEKVLLAPKHPYTQKLISCVPLLRGDKMPEFIPGAPPDLINPPPGCRFNPRCQHVMEKCRVNRPPAIDVDGRLVKCWLYE